MNMRRTNMGWGKWALAMMLAMAGIWMTGCASGPKTQFEEVYPQATTNQSSQDVTSIIDIIETGEAITITFSDLPIIVPPIEERVKEDGSITLLQNQTFQAAGKTRRQLEQEIRERYVPKYYVNMSVSVRQQENTRFYFVDGEVRTPGRQVYIGAMTVMKAVASGGGFTDFANKRKVRLIRSNGRIEIVDGRKALDNPKLDLPVYPGDRVVVPRSAW